MVKHNLYQNRGKVVVGNEYKLFERDKETQNGQFLLTLPLRLHVVLSFITNENLLCKTQKILICWCRIGFIGQMQGLIDFLPECKL